MSRRWWPAWLLLALLSGCEKTARNMYEQPRYKGLAASTLFADGAAARPAVPGAVAHSQGPLAGTSSGRAGVEDGIRADAAERADGLHYPLALAFLQRGRNRFDIYCAPCHSPVGDGDGMVVRRGFPAPPSFHNARLRRAPDRHFYDVITGGYGAMYAYADRIAPDDRWAIVAYIRVLQRSQDAKLADAPSDVVARLKQEVR